MGKIISTIIDRSIDLIIDLSKIDTHTQFKYIDIVLWIIFSISIKNQGFF